MNDRPRVLFCSDALIVDGVTSYVLHLGSTLARAGYPVAILGRWAGKGFQRRYRQEGLTVLSGVSATVGNRWFDAKARAFAPDLILTDSRRSFPLAVRLKKRLGRPVVTYFLDFLEKTDRPGRDVASLLRWSDVWTAAEEPLRRILCETAGTALPVLTLPRPLDGLVMPTSLPRVTNPFRVLCFGRLSSYKTAGMFYLLEHLDELERRIPGVEIILVGGSGWRLVKFKAMAARINLARRRRCVRVVGTQIDPTSWLADAHVVCGGSTAAIEAALSGRPVVAFTSYWFGQVTSENLDEALACYFAERGGRDRMDKPGVMERLIPALSDIYERYETLESELQVIRARLTAHFNARSAVAAFEAVAAAVLSRGQPKDRNTMTAD